MNDLVIPQAEKKAQKEQDKADAEKAVWVRVVYRPDYMHHH